MGKVLTVRFFCPPFSKREKALMLDRVSKFFLLHTHTHRKKFCYITKTDDNGSRLIRFETKYTKQMANKEGKKEKNLIKQNSKLSRFVYIYSIRIFSLINNLSDSVTYIFASITAPTPFSPPNPSFFLFSLPINHESEFFFSSANFFSSFSKASFAMTSNSSSTSSTPKTSGT